MRRHRSKGTHANFPPQTMGVSGGRFSRGIDEALSFTISFGASKPLYLLSICLYGGYCECRSRACGVWIRFIRVRFERFWVGLIGIWIKRFWIRRLRFKFERLRIGIIWIRIRRLRFRFKRFRIGIIWIRIRRFWFWVNRFRFRVVRVWDEWIGAGHSFKRRQRQRHSGA